MKENKVYFDSTISFSSV